MTRNFPDLDDTPRDEIFLTVDDQAILDGERGEGAALAMKIIVRMAIICDAPELISIEGSHIDGCGLLSKSGILFAERLADAGARVAVPTTLSMGPLDLQNWQSQNIPEPFARDAIRQADAYMRMGCIPAWTCAPYQGYNTPRFGQQVAWGESNAVCYANSVCGARTDRYGDYIDICAAITGRVPYRGLHRLENRRARLVFKLDGFDPERDWQDETDFAALGYILGRRSGDRVPAIVGLPGATNDQLKMLGASAASSGAVAMFHAVGITPEAPTYEVATYGQSPDETFIITPDDLEKARGSLSTASDDRPVDQVVFGCPHFSYDEFSRLADLLDEYPDKPFVAPITVITGESSCALARRGGLIDRLEARGVRIVLDTCLFHSPILPADMKVLMTNSGKAAYYCPGELDCEVAMGTLRECVESAISGKVVRLPKET